VLDGRAEREAAGTDFVTHRGTPAAVVRAASADQVAALLGYASERGISISPRAAGTNLCGGFVPGPSSVVLDMSGMTRILSVDPDGLRATVDPGLINADLQVALAPHGLCFSPDPASAAISTIGGNIMENAGGPGCIKHGVTFHHVAAVEVALADGRLVRFAEGDDIDLLGVIIGSEGILGVVTQATLKLRPLPAATWTALVSFDRLEDAVAAVSEVIAAGLSPAALELCDRRQVNLCEDWLPSGYPRTADAILFAELDGETDEVAAAAPVLEPLLRRWDPNLRLATDAVQRERLWAGRLAAAHAFKATGKAFYVCDVTVPRQRIPEMVIEARRIAAELDLDVATVAHAGDGNVHPVILYTAQERRRMRRGADAIAAAALALGGTLTGEHGIGTEKVQHMRRRFGPAEIAAFRAVKTVFDPAGILNPGVLLPPPSVDKPGLPMFTAAVGSALAGQALGRQQTLTPAGSGGIQVDAANLVVSAGGAEACAAVVKALRSRGLSSAALQHQGSVADLVQTAGRTGAARADLLAVEAELPDGPRVTFGSAAVKDVAGLDLKRLVAGSDGALGQVRRALFRVRPAG
jgi:glycolate oxidase